MTFPVFWWQNHLNRKHIDHLGAEGRKKATQLGIEKGGVVGVRLEASPASWKSPIAKYLGDDVKEKLVKSLGAETGDLFFIAAGEQDIVSCMKRSDNVSRI